MNWLQGNISKVDLFREAERTATHMFNIGLCFTNGKRMKYDFISQFMHCYAGMSSNNNLCEFRTMIAAQENDQEYLEAFKFLMSKNFTPLAVLKK